jgi:hypothetical protein
MRKRYLVLLLCALMLLSLGNIVALATPANITPYGYIKLDAAYDQSKTDNGNYAYWVLPQDEDDEFNMTSKQTRIGLKFEGPNTEKIEVSAKVEIDFYGGGAENKPNPMLRHAYMEMKYPGLCLLAGQTSDLFAPLNPSTLNYIVLWRCGNTGYRRPQIRLTKELGVGQNGKIVAAVSVNRSIGQGEDGEDSGVPTEEGRIAFSHRISGEKFAVLGVSGLWGRERSDLLGEKFETEAVAIDLSVPLGDRVVIQGEFYSGQNMAAFLGGIGQGIDIYNREEIETQGGWGHLSIVLSEFAKVNLGAGIDDPAISKSDTVNNRDENSAFFGNVIWKLASAVSMGIEYVRMETKYKETGTFHNNREQLSFLYTF